MAVQAHATAKYVRTSAQKAGLVLDLIRGRDVNSALATLRFARKGVARDIEKVLRSAIANASQKDGFGGDVENLYVNACYANQGPSQKRIRPAPMGRAFRVVKRTAHLTVQVAERPTQIAEPVSPKPAAGSPAGEGGPEPGTPKRPRGAKPKAKPAAKKKTAVKRTSKPAAKKKAASKSGRAKAKS
jgi:large subunit ribosomal protein L22